MTEAITALSTEWPVRDLREFEAALRFAPWRQRYMLGMP